MHNSFQAEYVSLLYSVHVKNDGHHLPEDKDSQTCILGLCFLRIKFH